jgi:hypothetical protein
MTAAMTTIPELFLSLWAIYDHPSDYPDKYVMRRWNLYRGDDTSYATEEMALADTLHGIRCKVPPGLACLPRFVGDDPSIVEVWI